MALPTFDASKHHLGLGASAGTLKGFMLDGGYVKEVQRESKSGPAEFGGQTDLIGQTPSMSRWTQDDFIGGAYAYTWGRDDAMFADSDGMMPSQQARSLISCPPMFQKKSGLTTNTPRSMFMVAGSIYVAAGNVLQRYQIDSDTLTSITLTGSDVFVFAEYDSNDQKIWAGIYSPGWNQYIRRYNTDLTDPSAGMTYYGPNASFGWSFLGGTIYNEYIVCQFGRKLFIGDPPDNPSASTSGEIKWRKVKRLPGRWKDSLAYNNTLYILLNDGSFKSLIYAFDGDTATPIVDFPFNFYAKCMIEYAGRIFVGGTGTDVNGGEHYAELYEVTGSSVRLVRTFSPETRNYFLGGVAGEWPQSIDDLTIHEGLLWMAQKGKKMVAYDVTSDGFFGAAAIPTSGLNFPKLISGRGRLWGLGSDGGIWRIAQPADASASWNPTFVSSDFAYEIADLKRWSEIQVMSRYGSVFSIEYSTNSGGSWTTVSHTTTSDGQVHFAKADLSALAASKIIRFRIKLTSTGDAGDAKTYHRELVAFTVSFSMASETRKKAWGVTINASENIETRDAQYAEATVQAYLPSEVRDQLWAWMDSQTPLVLHDLGGDEYNVKIESLRETMPVIGPNVTNDEPEAHFAVTLLQV